MGKHQTSLLGVAPELRSLWYIHAKVTPAVFPDPVGAINTSGQSPSAMVRCQVKG